MASRAWHPCADPSCGTPCPPGQSRCADHARAHEQARGTRQQRGYDAGHDRLRRNLVPLHRIGHLVCWRCGLPIHPDEPFDLGHDDHDRSVTRGPEHAYRCNRSAAGRASHDHRPL